MILEKIERLVDLSVSIDLSTVGETCEAKAAQQSCYYNLNHLNRKIENNQTLIETVSKADIPLPKLENKKEKIVTTLEKMENLSLSISQISKENDKQKKNEKK